MNIKVNGIISISISIMIILLTYQVLKVDGDKSVGPDLNVSSFTFSDPGINDLREDHKTKISIGITNRGTGEINQTWTIKVTDGKYIIRKEEITNQIAPGETFFYNISNYKLRKGERLFQVNLDINNNINETFEDNNVYSNHVAVKAQKPNEIQFILMPLILMLTGLGILLLYLYYRKKGKNRKNEDEKIQNALRHFR